MIPGQNLRAGDSLPAMNVKDRMVRIGRPRPIVILGAVLALSVGTRAPGQDAANDRVAWLREHLIELRSADPAQPDDADLLPLLDLIADARIIQLGEQTHGDGTAFGLRTRVIRFLHEHAHIDTLAFESGFFECRATDAALSDATIPLPDAIDQGIYPIWAESREVQPLFEYLRASRVTDRPLALLGYDVQFSRPSTPDRLPRELFAYLDQLECTALDADAHATLQSLIATIASAGRLKIDEANHAANRQVLVQLAAALDKPDDADLDRRWWRQVVNSLQRMEENAYLGSCAPRFDPTNMEASTRSPFRILASSARERGMAENLFWWLDHARHDQRQVVWAANNHVAHGSRRVALRDPSEDGDSPRVIPAGEHLREALGDGVYTLLTVPYSGTWAAPSIRTAEGELRWTDGSYAPAPPDSLAGLLHHTGAAYAVLDLRVARNDPNHWLNQPIVIRPGMFGGEAIVPGDYCDAILFIDEMKPSTPRAEP